MNKEILNWGRLVRESDNWVWQDGVLWDQTLLSCPIQSSPAHPLQRALVKYVYGNHNRSSAVRQNLGQILEAVGDDEWGLNLGAGDQRLHSRVLNLDVFNAEGIDIVGTGSELPFQDNTLSLVVCQEVLEHVASPAAVIAEVYRVLQPGGIFYFQVPFQIGFHPGPKDYWRFSRQGCEEMVKSQNWAVEKIGLSQGHGTALYRISVEFVAVTASCLSEKLYLPAKAVSSIVLSPIKLFDCITEMSQQKDRIAAGYFCIARK